MGQVHGTAHGTGHCSALHPAVAKKLRLTLEEKNVWLLMFALRKLNFSSSTFGWGSWGDSTTNLGDSMIEGATCFPATIGFGTGLQIYIWHKHFISPPPPPPQAPLDSMNTATSLQTMKPPPSLLAVSAALHSMQGRSRGTGRVAHSWWRKNQGAAWEATRQGDTDSQQEQGPAGQSCQHWEMKRLGFHFWKSTPISSGPF